MSMLTCAEVRDLAPELALGVLGGAERAEALTHIDDCTPCRSVVGELTQAGELLPLLAREAEPPPGFEGRVLAALGGGRRRGRLRGLAVVAAAAAAAAIVSVATVRVVDRGRDDARVVTESVVSEVNSAPMVGAGGATVGWAFASDGRPAAVGISVGYLLPPGSYAIEAVSAEGAKLTLGTMQVTDGRGVWTGTTKASHDGLAVISLVDAAGQEVCQASLV
ncbi:MAG: zf-HC2 domain-containing protein [Actinomycetota bacterium]